jgi:gliding motility-associated-like protein
MKYFIIIAFIFLASFGARASHLLGGEIYYDYIGNDRYKVTLMLFRDCENSQTDFDDSLTITVYHSDSTDYFQFKWFQLTPQSNVSADNGDPCVVPPPGICVNKAAYIDTFTLPFTPKGYYLSYQRGNWSGAIQNITNPNGIGMTLTSQIPGSELTATPNSSVRFNVLPPLVHCSGQEKFFDQSVTDPDGDSLFYRLCAPIRSNQVNPLIDDGKPFNPVNYELGYSFNNPLGPGSVFEIDSADGTLHSIPNIADPFLTSICIDEYRNDSLINTSNRPFNFEVVICDVVIPFTINADVTGGIFQDSSLIAEDCSERPIYFARADSTDTLRIDIKVTGTATNGVDFTFLPDSLIMYPGTLFDTLLIKAFYDSLDEPTESLQIVISFFDICDGETDSIVISLSILNYNMMSLDLLFDSLNFCPDAGEKILIEPVFSGGLQPYTYTWQTNETTTYGNSLNLNVPDFDVQDFESPYYIHIEDICLKEVESDTTIIFNQCRIRVPNIVTLNGDGINELFIIKNRFDYPGVELMVYDRWGKRIFHSANYLNNWYLTYPDGQLLGEGTYFYTARVIADEKYTYDDVEEVKFQTQGSFRVVK